MPLIAARVPGVQFVVARAPNLPDELFEPLRGVGGSRIAEIAGRTDDVLSASDVVVTASGTATVQTAIHERPMVIVYRLSPLTYRLGKRFVKVDTFGMANLVAGRRIVPELIQDAFTPDAVRARDGAVLRGRGLRRADARRAGRGARQARRWRGQPESGRAGAGGVRPTPRAASG